MKVSIAMATCNGAAHVGEQLGSFIAQEHLPDELIVCDDQSTDGTRDIVQAFAREAPFPVRLEANPVRLGVAANFNRALSLCTGDLVFLSDQDDVWMPAKIATMAAAAADDPDHGCFINDAWLADGELRTVGASKMQRIREAGMPETMMVMGCCTVFRSALLQLLLPIPPEQRAHDNWLVQVSDLLGSTCRLELPLQYYRRHGANVSVNAVNRLQVPNAAVRLRERGSDLARRATSNRGMRTEHLFHAQAARRLRERAGSTAIDPAQLAAACRVAETRAARLQRRLEIRALPRVRRLRPVAAMLLDGGYDGISRATDAVKDLMVGRDEFA